jgi:hypothetical protein
MEFVITFEPPITPQCALAMPGEVRGSLAYYTPDRVAIASCYHGVAYMSLKCPCRSNHRAFVLVDPKLLPGEVLPTRVQPARFEVFPIDPPDIKRDVAWFTCPDELSHLHSQARTVAATGPRVGDIVYVETSHGRFEHKVEDLPPRGSHPELRLSLSRNPAGVGIPSSFVAGQSGSPVLNQAGELVAVVRDSGGHCGRVVV